MLLSLLISFLIKLFSVTNLEFRLTRLKLDAEGCENFGDKDNRSCDGESGENEKFESTI